MSNTIKRNISFSMPDITEEEIQEVADTLRSGWITTGRKVKQFEEKIKSCIHTDNAACFSSATAAEEMNLRMLGIGEGDEVIVPAYTYTATAAAAVHAGSRIRFVDSGKDSAEMDYDALESVVNENTKAVIPVDIGGIMCDYERIFSIAENKKHLFRPSAPLQDALGRIAVVADAAHSFGASRNGRMAGETADFTSFSFHAVKNCTTAEGGAAAWRTIDGIDDGELYHKYQMYALHGQSKDAFTKLQKGSWEYDIAGVWYKCNMTDVHASIGIKQLERYPGILAKREKIIRQYDKAFDRAGIGHLQHYGKDYRSSGHLYAVRLPGVSEKQRNEIIYRMAEQGIACNVHYKPLPMMSAYKEMGWDIADFPNAYRYYENLITLPLHTLLSDDDVAYIIDNLLKIAGGYGAVGYE